MPAITPAISRTFIDRVKLPPLRRRAALLGDTPPVELRAGDPQSLVVGSSLVAAAANVSEETREDLVNCTLFAQLAATGTVGDPADIARWYDAYFKTLTAVGWAQSDTRLEEYEFSGKNAEAHHAIVKVLTALLGPQAAVLMIVKAALDALQSMNENSPWIALFERESKLGRSARFQVATAQVDADGLLQAALVGFSLETKSTLSQVLFFKYSTSSTSLKYAAGKATIYEAALRELRQPIAARLAAYRAAYVGEVKLPVLPAGLLKPARRPKAKPAPEGLLGGSVVVAPPPAARLTRALLR